MLLCSAKRKGAKWDAAPVLWQIMYAVSLFRRKTGRQVEACL